MYLTRYDVIISREGDITKKVFDCDKTGAFNYFDEVVKTLHNYLFGSSGGHTEDYSGAAVVQFDDYNGTVTYLKVDGFNNLNYWDNIVNSRNYKNVPKEKDNTTPAV